MMPLNTTSCPIYTIHEYLAAEAKTFNADKSLTDLTEELGSPSPALVAGIALAVLGLIGLLFGAKLVRPTLCVVCAIVGAAFTQALLFNVDYFAAHTPCIVGGVVIVLAAVATALLGLFLLNFAFFIGGAAVGVALVMTFFHFFPALDVSLFGLPTLEGHGLIPFYAAALIAGLGIGLLLVRKKEQQVILIVLTSFVCACVVTKGAMMINASQGGPTIPSEASAGVVIAFAVLGMLFQAWRLRKERRAKENVTYLPYTENSDARQRMLRP